MRVFRVCHRWHDRYGHGIGTGPYAFGYTSFPEYAARLADPMRWCHRGGTHPSPLAEGIDFDPYDVCGFPSMEALTTWFEHHWRLRLHQAGFRITEFETPEEYVKRGQCQVMFDARKAKAKRHHTLAHGCDLLHEGRDLKAEDQMCTSTWRLSGGTDRDLRPGPEDVIIRVPRRPRPVPGLV
ncbi:hypothetical protein PBI_NESBITT_56 [Streptomyces phage Nesbitt]|uniref:Uncharacterized protein n=2 Tax=Abbeymikolonvirus abbeymikolon TaxID=2734213 RepID=A0A2P1JT50_9CAUD|nr:hypothetical protein HOS57_gp54 [Streptomyces phage AbbeyMikolon]AUG87128.1 hypothetical protein SEA_ABBEYMIKOLON_58 [Streptomyces phage AbbeyMikolon]AVO22313.1 hypothetical protein PBI_NESBITT_56 [Streptomyces phage Nesbitt]